MTTIWKHQFRITDEQTLQLPYGTKKVLHVGLDPNSNPCIWCETDLDKNNHLVSRPLTLFVVGTGNPVPEEAICYLGSFVQDFFVWHVYCDNIAAK